MGAVGRWRRPPLPYEYHRRLWRLIRSGVGVQKAAGMIGVSYPWAHKVVDDAGGVNPVPVADPVGRYLSFAEREEVLRLHAAGESMRAIARALGRDPATISRELRRGATSRYGYKPSVAQAKVDAGRRARRESKLANNEKLRLYVQTSLDADLSPEQICGRLTVDYPDDPEMRVSTETIYQALYIQARGGLKRELTQHLRTHRQIRKPRGTENARRTRIPNMINISQRPASVEDRAVPGHWEGDLIMGSTASNSAVGTLVERSTGFVMLLHLPHGHSAPNVQEALIAKMGTLPEQLRRSLTWDQGREMTNHAAIADSLDFNVYFCDPHSPWQRGSNENTNGLLRQYLPKGSDLSFYGEGLLDNIATQLNSRPRKRHQFRTPSEVLDQLLSEPEPGVA